MACLRHNQPTGGGAGGSLAWFAELPGLSVSAGGRFFCAIFIIVAMSIMNLHGRGRGGGGDDASSGVEGAAAWEGTRSAVGKRGHGADCRCASPR